MSRDLAGKKIVIVGATGVLGAALASQLHSSGALVSAVVRDAGRLDTSAISAHAIADVTDSALCAHEALAPSPLLTGVRYFASEFGPAVAAPSATPTSGRS